MCANRKSQLLWVNQKFATSAQRTAAAAAIAAADAPPNIYDLAMPKHLADRGMLTPTHTPKGIDQLVLKAAADGTPPNSYDLAVADLRAAQQRGH